MSLMISEKSLTCESNEFCLISSELLRAGITIRFKAVGKSMHPLIRDGDILFVAPVKPFNIRLGDVVLFTNHSGRPIIHRVIKIRKCGEEPCLLIRGDRSIQSDGYISLSSVYGLVIKIDREGTLIKSEGPIFKFLGKLASWHSRIQSGNTWFYRMVFQILKRLPVFSRYLS